MVLFPLIAPVNVDMLFFQFAIFFYAYGCYLHWGFESNWPDAHHPWINTAYQHNLHHNKSIMNKPLHTGFMFKVWDQAFGTVYLILSLILSLLLSLSRCGTRPLAPSTTESAIVSSASRRPGSARASSSTRWRSQTTACSCSRPSGRPS